MLRWIRTVPLPPHDEGGSFDHAGVHRGGDHLYVAHTANDSIEVVDLDHLRHEGTLTGFAGVAGAAVCEERNLLVATCRGAGAVALRPVGATEAPRLVTAGARPNGLAIASAESVALAGCLGEPGPPTMAIIDLARGSRAFASPLPGRPRWAVHDPTKGCFFVNIAAPPQILAIRATAPFDVLRAIPIPAVGPHGLDLDERRGVLHCACDEGSVICLEAATGRVVSQVAIAGSPDVAFFNARRDRLYVAVAEPGLLQSIDTAAGRVVETVETGKGAKTFGFDSERERVFALVPGSHSAEVFEEV